MRYLLLTLLYFAFASELASGQCMTIPVSMEQRVDMSDVIAEGEVITQSSYFNEDRSLIYTSHLLKVSRYLSLNPTTEFIEVITEGGIVGNTMLKVEPELTINTGDKGIFFLEYFDNSNSYDEIVKFRGVAANQSVLIYDKVEGNLIDAYFNFTNAELQLIPLLEKLSGNSFKFTNGNGQNNKNSGVPLPLPLVFPTITAITSPSTAGTFTSVVITGNNFGPGPMNGTQQLEFRDANNGGAGFISTPLNHIVAWTNTSITAWVPTGAGSGTIRVTNNLNETTTSGVSITINYNESNVNSGGTYYQPDLIDDNGLGGYTYRYNNTFNGNAAAVGAFERALQTWRCNTFVNFSHSGTSAIACQALDGINIVSFDGSCALPAGVLGVSYSFYSSCGSGNWYLNENDLKFRTNGTGGINWNYGPAPTAGGLFDFESVCLHELGHSHQLGHTITPVTVMNYAVGPNTDRRTLNAVSEIAGGNDIMSRSVVANSCSPGPMIALSLSNCSINAPVADFIGSPTSGCNSFSVTFTDQSLNTPNSWSWSFPGGVPAAFVGQNPPPILYSTPGTYMVTLTVGNPSGNDSETKTNYITVNSCPPPVSDFSATPKIVCEGQPVQFTDLSTNTPTSWQWILPGSAAGTSAIQNPTTTYPAAGLYDVTLIASNPYGSDTLIKTSYINVISCPPAPVPNFSASSTTVCAGVNVNFTDLSTNSPNYWQWTFTGGTPATSLLQNPSVSYASAGVYPVTLTVSNSGGSGTVTFPGFITVNVCTQPTADFAGWPSTVCEGQQVNFTDLSSNNPTSWNWSFPGGTPVASATANPVITYNTAGTYNVSLTATNAFGSGSVTKNLYITVAACPPAGSGLIVNDGSLIHVQNAALVTIQGGLINQDNGTNIGNIDNTGLITLTGDWTNNSSGQAFINSSPGVTELNGAAQMIRGTTPTLYYTLTLTGSGIKSQDVDAYVEGLLNLNDRELATNDHVMHVLNTSATAITRTGGLNSTPVQGFVSSTGNGRLRRNTASASAYFFPVGSSLVNPRFRPVMLNPSGTTPNTYSVRFVNHNPTIDGFDVTLKDASLGTVNPLWYQKINHDAGSSDPDVRLYFDATADMIPPLPSLLMTQWAYNAPPVQWRAINGVTIAGVASPALSSVTKSGWTTFISENFNLAPQSIPLPVELANFSANCDQGKILLKWTTLSEKNTSHFIIEKGLNPDTFEPIGSIKASGNSVSPVDYAFDAGKGENSNTVYFRLIQVDQDGNFELSPVIPATCKGSAQPYIALYPNPVNEILEIIVNDNRASNYSINVLNTLGQAIYLKSISTSAGFNQFRISFTDFASGIYFIRIESPELQQSFKIVVRH